MKQTSKIILLAVMFVFTSLAQAQLGGMLKKVKNTVQSGGSTGSQTSAVVSKTSLNWAQYPQAPGITMMSLLRHTKVLSSGYLRPNFYRGTFIPNKTKNGEEIDLMTDRYLLMIKTYVDGQLVKEANYSDGEFLEGYKQLVFQENNDNDSQIELKKEGKYRLDFYAGGTMFYTFEFEVAKKMDSDAYSNDPLLWYAKGPWEKMAYLENQSTGTLVFGFFNMHTEFKPNPNDASATGKKMEWTADLYKNGKQISLNQKEKKSETIQKGEWKEFTTAFNLGSDYFKTANLTDGNYQVKLQITGESSPRIYDFSVINNKIVYSDKQDKSKTDAKTVIEGWNNVYWLEQK